MTKKPYIHIGWNGIGMFPLSLQNSCRHVSNWRQSRNLSVVSVKFSAEFRSFRNYMKDEKWSLLQKLFALLCNFLLATQ